MTRRKLVSSHSPREYLTKCNKAINIYWDFYTVLDKPEKRGFVVTNFTLNNRFLCFKPEFPTRGRFNTTAFPDELRRELQVFFYTKCDFSKENFEKLGFIIELAIMLIKHSKHFENHCMSFYEMAVRTGS